MAAFLRLVRGSEASSQQYTRCLLCEMLAAKTGASRSHHPRFYQASRENINMNLILVIAALLADVIQTIYYAMMLLERRKK